MNRRSGYDFTGEELELFIEGGNTPYQMAQVALPEDFFDMPGLYEIPPEQVLLKPALLTS